jgi:uncharacterized protein
MYTVFADSFYFFALGNRFDPAHVKALTFSQTFHGRLVTTGFVLVELADGCARTAQRRAVAAETVSELQNNPHVAIVPFTDQLFEQGIGLYQQRPDKEWSLTDCISFVVMQREGITYALTGDNHFEQAGFVGLLK